MQRFSPEAMKDHPFKRLKGFDKSECLLCRYRGLCGFGCPATTLAICGDVRFPDPIKCSFSNIWERDILPILPDRLQQKFSAAIDYEGKHPRQFRNIIEILDGYNYIVNQVKRLMTQFFRHIK